MVSIFTVIATVAAMGPTTLVLAVVKVAALLVCSQTRAVPRVNPYGSNVHVRGREPRVFDGGCSVSIQEWLFEVEEACNLRNICLERERVAFAASYLEGNAKEWFLIRSVRKFPATNQLVEFQVCSSWPVQSREQTGTNANQTFPDEANGYFGGLYSRILVVEFTS